MKNEVSAYVFIAFLVISLIPGVALAWGNVVLGVSLLVALGVEQYLKAKKEGLAEVERERISRLESDLKSLISSDEMRKLRSGR